MFDDAIARRDLAAYRRRGPSRSTALLIAAMRDHGPSIDTLLDVGGGVGAIAHELLHAGVSLALLVDGSASYVAAAREESDRRGTGARLQLRSADLVEIADDVPPADLVTLDKVVCCYPDLDALLAVSAGHARRAVGIVYPRDSWWVRLVIALENRVRRLRGNDFRNYVHSNSSIESTLRDVGFAMRFSKRGAWWVIAVFERT